MDFNSIFKQVYEKISKIEGSAFEKKEKRKKKYIDTIKQTNTHYESPRKRGEKEAEII